MFNERRGEEVNEYHAFLYTLSGIEPCTKSRLERLNFGRFSNQIDECIARGFIEVRSQNESGEGLYYVSDKGKEIIK